MTTFVDVANGFNGVGPGGTNGRAGLVDGDAAINLGVVTLPNDAFAPGDGDFSIVFWIQPDALPTFGKVLFEATFSTLPPNGFDLFLEPDGTVSAQGTSVGGVGQENFLTGTHAIDTSTGHMIAFTRRYATEQWSIYIDGVVDQDHVTMPLAGRLDGVGVGPTTIGRVSQGQGGVYDEFATFYSELSAGAIQSLWNARNDFAFYSANVLSRSPQNYYHLDELGPITPAVTAGTGWYVGQIYMGSGVPRPVPVPFIGELIPFRNSNYGAMIRPPQVTPPAVEPSQIMGYSVSEFTSSYSAVITTEDVNPNMNMMNCQGNGNAITLNDRQIVVPVVGDGSGNGCPGGGTVLGVALIERGAGTTVTVTDIQASFIGTAFFTGRSSFLVRVDDTHFIMNRGGATVDFCSVSGSTVSVDFTQSLGLPGFFWEPLTVVGNKIIYYNGFSDLGVATFTMGGGISAMAQTSFVSIGLGSGSVGPVGVIDGTGDILISSGLTYPFGYAVAWNGGTGFSAAVPTISDLVDFPTGNATQLLIGANGGASPTRANGQPLANYPYFTIATSGATPYLSIMGQSGTSTSVVRSREALPISEPGLLSSSLSSAYHFDGQGAVVLQTDPGTPYFSYIQGFSW